MCPFDGKKGQKKMQMFFSIWYLLVLTLLRERFDLFSCVLGRLETKSLYKNLSIYNIIRWFAGPMGQTTRWPSVWCSKYYFFFHKILQNSLQKHFQFIFWKITKMKIKSFECPNSIRNWNFRHLVNESFVPSAQWTSVLYCRLSDL